MQILIDIPDDYNGKDFTDTIYKAIVTGIVLPKGHGRLIDADTLEGTGQLQLMPNGNGKYTEQIIYTQNAIDCAKTVIPADKEAKNEERD